MEVVEDTEEWMIAGVVAAVVDIVMVMGTVGCLMKLAFQLEIAV
jgi:hypothetical protein